MRYRIDDAELAGDFLKALQRIGPIARAEHEPDGTIRDGDAFRWEAFHEGVVINAIPENNGPGRNDDMEGFRWFLSRLTIYAQYKTVFNKDDADAASWFRKHFLFDSNDEADKTLGLEVLAGRYWRKARESLRESAASARSGEGNTIKHR